MNQLQQLLSRRILILDGAMGTMLQAYDFSEEDFRGDLFSHWEVPLKGNNDLLSLTQPAAIKTIHQEYLEAGADILETNTFSSTRIALADYRLEDYAYQLNLESARLAREAAQEYTAQTPDQPRFVAGAMGPTNKTASLSPDVNNPGFRAISFDQLREAYYEQAKGLLDGGVDILLVETVFDTLNAKAALFAIDQLQEETQKAIPIMLSGTITDASGRTLSGQTPEAFLISVEHIPLLSIGFNCALGPRQLTPHIEALAKNASFCISAYPNAGLPNAFGAYDQSPQEMAQEIETYLQKELVNIVGGCCGTTPEHIKAISEVAKKYTPRPIKTQ